MVNAPTRKVIIEVEGVVVDVISTREYLVKVTHGDYTDKLINATISGSLYYDGIVLFKKDKVALDIRTSSPDRGLITYRL